MPGDFFNGYRRFLGRGNLMTGTAIRFHPLDDLLQPLGQSSSNTSCLSPVSPPNRYFSTKIFISKSTIINVVV